MGGQGPNREQDGEMEFSSDELVEMKVEVAGREEPAAGKRKKRALRVPADEVTRTPAVSLTTQPDLPAVPASGADDAVDDAFGNGKRAEAEVAARPEFVGAELSPADGTATSLSDEDLEPDVTIERDGPAPLAKAIARLPPNLRALVRAVGPVGTARPAHEATEVEQLDSAELEVVDAREGARDERTVIVEAEPELTEDDEEHAEVAADDMTLEPEEHAPRERKRTLPPAMPPSAPMSPRARSITPHIPIPAYGIPAVPSGQVAGIAPAMPPLSPPPPPQADGEGLRPRRRRRAKQWFEEVFDDDYLRTLPFLSSRQTEREASFIAESLEVPTGGTVLDLACGYGRHAMELAGKGIKVTGLDLSLPLLIRAADAARRIGVGVNFVHGDMREMSFESEFDGAYCMFTSFGFFDDDTNRKVAANLQRALKPGGRVLIELVNRDYITRDLPTRVWWQGEGCVVLEEVDFNYFSSRLQVQRSIIIDDGRQLEQEISIRAYSLHEIGKVLHHAGFRVIEVSGGLGLRGKFFGAHSRQLLVLAEKKPAP